jgi:hypothetical protein
METILTIPKELESLESLVKLKKKKKDEGLKVVNLTKVEDHLQCVELTYTRISTTKHYIY